jgi:flagellum-specific peptidoglycan hydrolase FlgJ
MKPIDYIQIVMNAVVIILMIIILCIHSDLPESPPKEMAVKSEQPYFFLTEIPNRELVSKALEYYGIQHSDIVLAQSILETGHYRSKLCKENNNLFGLYNSKKKEYFKFTHWTESVEAYKKYIQYKYQGGDYYNFIDSIGYASDSLYIPKLKNIVKRYVVK